MVASKSEAKEISSIILEYINRRDAMDLMEEVWERVGQYTTNQSLQETITILQKLITEH